MNREDGKIMCLRSCLGLAQTNMIRGLEGQVGVNPHKILLPFLHSSPHWIGRETDYCYQPKEEKGGSKKASKSRPRFDLLPRQRLILQSIHWKVRRSQADPLSGVNFGITTATGKQQMSR